MLINITASNSGFRDNFGQYGAFYAHFWHFFDQMSLRNIVAMATPKNPGDQKLLEMVC